MMLSAVVTIILSFGHVLGRSVDYTSVQPVNAKTSGGGFWETQLAPKAVDVPFGNSHLAVWEHLTSPGRFYVSPLVMLLPDSLQFRKNILTGGNKITLDILMWSEEACDAVYYKLKGDHEGLDKDDISLLPMEKLRLVWRGSLALNSSVVTLPDTWMSNTDKQRVVSFDLICHNETWCHEIMEAIQETPELLRGLELEYVASAKRTSRKHVAVTGTQFMDSSLFANLANMPEAMGSMRYVTSDDLNLMATQVASNIVASIIRDSDYEAQADEISVVNIIKDFLGKHQESTEGFNNAKWDSVFWNPEFARPDKITSAVNEAFEKSTNDSEKLKMTERTSRKSGGFSLFRLFSGGGGSQTFTKTSIGDKLSQLWEGKAHAEWNGEKFVVKPMMLHRLNMAEFNTTNSVTFTDVKLYPNERTALIRVNVDYMKQKVKEARDVGMTHIYDRVDNLGEEFNFILSRLESRINATSSDVQHMTANVKNYTQKFENLKDSLTYKDCTSIKEANSLTFDGVYNLSLPRVGHVPALCKMDKKGKGWTVLLRRSDHMNPHLDFDKDFKAYTGGFGNVSAEYWLGLEAMHALTSDKYLGRKKVRFELKDHSGKKYWIEYNDFEVHDRGDNYRLSVGARAAGTAPDHFGYHSNNGFTTHDNDNDGNSGNLAHTYRAGWWFGSSYQVLLTGAHGSDNMKGTDGTALGVYWKHIPKTSTMKSLSYVEMMVS